MGVVFFLSAENVSDLSSVLISDVQNSCMNYEWRWFTHPADINTENLWKNTTCGQEGGGNVKIMSHNRWQLQILLVAIISLSLILWKWAKNDYNFFGCLLAFATIAFNMAINVEKCLPNAINQQHKSSACGVASYGSYWGLSYGKQRKQRTPLPSKALKLS